MTDADFNIEFTRVLADAFAGLGVRHVCISPGSRNTPLVVAFAEHPDIVDWSHHDERSGAFFALGVARASGDAVALICTSGTAAAEYLPAILEAKASRVPLLVLTADRPPELRDVGASQTVDQVKIYGDAVKWFHGSGPPDIEAVRTAPALAAHAWGEASSTPAGPVHLNLAFRDPLTPPPDTRTAATEGISPRAAVSLPAHTPSPETVQRLADHMAGKRTLFVAGALPAAASGPVGTLAETVGAVVFADPQSALRTGPPGSAITTADLLATTGALDTDPPDVVVRWGPIPTSKATWRWLESHPEIPQIIVDPGGHRDPLASAASMVRCDVGATATALLSASPTPGPSAWTARWRSLDETALTALDSALVDEAFPNEPAVARTVWESAQEGSILLVGSSMPIRDIDAFGGRRNGDIEVIANRGTAGIDGLISTALGAVAAGDRPGVALLGDVATLHDLNALATVKRLDLPLTVVVVHNDGGGIFGLLPQANPDRLDPAVFERHLGTPHGTDFVAVARALGLAAQRVETRSQLVEAVSTSGPQLVEIRTNRSEVPRLRHRLIEAVRGTLLSSR